MTAWRNSLAPRNEPARAGVVGWPVSHSLSPRLHNYWLKKYKLNGNYEAIAAASEELENILSRLLNQGYAGVNLTIPHKEKALALVDETDDIAQRIGAVNTIIMKDGKLLGTNTDVYGFIESLKAEMHDAPAGNALVLGAGGAARAVCAGLLKEGWDVTLAGRTRQRAETLAENFGEGSMHVIGWSEVEGAMESTGLLVNTTPLGMKGQPPLLLSLGALTPAAWVCDIVYAPEKTVRTEQYSDPTFTDLLAEARDKGNPVVRGLGMLLYQAQPAFEAWFGVKPEVTGELFSYMQEALA
jgi:shikimate dehydrogenase